MGVLGALFGGAYLGLGGSKAKPTPGATPPINASSPDEADFIKSVLPLLSSTAELKQLGPMDVLTPNVGSLWRRPRRNKRAKVTKKPWGSGGRRKRTSHNAWDWERSVPVYNESIEAFNSRLDCLLRFKACWTLQASRCLLAHSGSRKTLYGCLIW